MKKINKIVAVILAVVMSFAAVSVVAFAADAETYEVTFADLPYDISPYRNDFIADYMGYEYGVDYWFVITNNEDSTFIIDGVEHNVAAGTTTEIKGAPSSISVKAGTTLEFTVAVADYVEPQTVRVIAFATGTPTDELAELDPLSSDLTVNPGEPYEQYYIAKSSVGTYGIKPDKDITVCVSEYHLYNDCFLYEFPSSSYYTANRVLFCGDSFTDEDCIADPASYTSVEWDNTKVIYENETLLFEVRMDLDSEYDLHYDSYEVYYMVDQFGYIVGELSGTEKVYLEPIYSYTDTETNEQVDIYAIPNVNSDVTIKITNTVTYTVSMLAELLSDFSLDSLEDIDFDSIDMSPMLELMLRLLKLIVKMLNAFGLDVSIEDLIG